MEVTLHPTEIRRTAPSRLLGEAEASVGAERVGVREVIPFFITPPNNSSLTAVKGWKSTYSTTPTAHWMPLTILLKLASHPSPNNNLDIDYDGYIAPLDDDTDGDGLKDWEENRDLDMQIDGITSVWDLYNLSLIHI